MSRNSWWSRGVAWLSRTAVQSRPVAESLAPPAAAPPLAPPVHGAPATDPPGSRRRRRRSQWTYLLPGLLAMAAALGIVRSQMTRLPELSAGGQYVVREGELFEIDLQAL